MNDPAQKNLDAVESRRSDASRRQVGTRRKIYHFVGKPILRGLLALLGASYRVTSVSGGQHIEHFIKSGELCAPCYWHQHHVIGSTLIKSWIKRGFRACFLVSASVDGDVPEQIARGWGAEVIRGSANRTGTLALRDMQGMMKRGYSIITTADGPNGPQHEFKMGAVLMARIAGVPIIPIGVAAERAWFLDRWDKFMIPKPFSRISITVGEPYSIPAKTPLDKLESHRQAVQAGVMQAVADSESRLSVFAEARH